MPRLRVALFTAVIAALVAMVAPSARVQAQGDPPDAGAQARKQEFETAMDAGIKAGTTGPADVTLIDQAVLKLPDDYAFIPKTEGARIMRAMGNSVSAQAFAGLILGTGPNDDWVIEIQYIKEGHIKDEDSRWNADDLLATIRENNEAANEERAQNGFAQLELVRWIEPPAYDAKAHRLVWSLLAKEKGEPDSAADTVNYNTYALGRDGYFSLNLVTSSDTVETDKRAAQDMLAALQYNSGKAYEDFNASTDHLAEYGLLALIGGVAAKKLGLFAVIGAFVLKFAKVIALGVFAFGASVWNFVRRRLKGTT